MAITLDTILERVEKPARYTGGELHATSKPFESADIHFAFCFPDIYEVAMSHLGMKILYAALNNQPGVLCERCCMPWTDLDAELRASGIPLFTLESRTPLNRFEIIGFTLQYEMSYTNILEMLHLGGVPLCREDRRENDPIVVAGGPCAFNPEPLHAFIDAFMIGDGEESILALTQTIREGRAAGLPRAEILKKLAGLEGVYVPSLYRDEYNEDGTFKALVPLCPEAPATIRKCLVTDFENALIPCETPVPYLQPVFDRITLEIMRGCTRGCRFCQAGMLYRPVRERSVGRLVQAAKDSVKATGYEEISLSSLSSSDYSHIEELTRRLSEELCADRVSLSLPSLRVDKFVQDTLTHTQKVKKSSLTFAPEAGTQRLRDVINKNVTEDDLFNTLNNAFSNGWNAVKLYFMMGLPTETDEDLVGIAEMAKVAARAYYSVPKEKRVKGLRVTCSTAVFVPKPFTPFQWCAQDVPEEVHRKQRLVKEKFLPLKSAAFHYHDCGTSEMEACFATGDRRLSKVLLRAWELGARMDGWTDLFRYDLWKQAFEDCGLSVDFYAHRQRSLDEVLPWDHIDCGVTKEFLAREYQKALRGETTRDCREGCNGCGLQRVKGACAGCE